MSFLAQLDAAAAGHSMTATPVLRLPLREAPPNHRPNDNRGPTSRHATPRKIESDVWLNDLTSQQTLGRVTSDAVTERGRRVSTTLCEVTIDADMRVTRGRDALRRGLHSHLIAFDGLPLGA